MSEMHKMRFNLLCLTNLVDLPRVGVFRQLEFIMIGDGVTDADLVKKHTPHQWNSPVTLRKFASLLGLCDAIVKMIPTPAEQAEQMRALFRVPFKQGDRVNLVALEWFEAWGKYTGFKSSATGENPGPIDNSGLVEDRLRLRPRLVNHRDYEPISSDAWNSLFSWYGGGPELLACMTESSLKYLVPALITGQVTVIGKNSLKRVTVKLIEGVSIRRIKTDACERLKLESCNYRICLLEDGEIGNQLDESLSWNEAGLTDGAELVLKKIVQLQRPNIVNLNKFKDMILPQNSSESGTLVRRRRFVAEWAPKSPGICGFQNIGNTCYINAALQCLFHAPGLVEFFLSDEKPWRKICDGGIHPFVTTFANLLISYWSGISSVIAPRDLKTAISRKTERFSGYGEQDSHEFIMFVLDCLHQDLNVANPAPGFVTDNVGVRGNGADDAEMARNSLEVFRSRDNSKITELFQGFTKSKITCPACHSSVTMLEPYQTLSLPLPCNRTPEKYLFVFVPYDPLKPKRQMHLKQLFSAPAEAIQKLGKRLGIENLHVAFAEVTSKGTIKWLNKPRCVESGDSSLWVFEIPDPAKPYAVVRLTGPKSLKIDGPYLVATNKPNTTLDEMEKILLSYFAYLWAPDGRFDLRPVTSSISKLRDKLKSMRKGNPDGPKLFVSIMSKKKRLLKCEESTPFIFKHHVHAKLNLAHTLQGFNWPRLQRGINELITPAGEYSEVSLEQCLAEFLQDGLLDSANKWQCPNCRTFVCARKETSIWSSPPILIIHLKRFQQTLSGNRKLETHVSFPSEFELPSDQFRCRYRLFAVDEHVGCMNSGHYIARVYCETKCSWYRFSDSTFDTCTEQSVHSPNAYVLFYQRVSENSV